MTTTATATQQQHHHQQETKLMKTTSTKPTSEKPHRITRSMAQEMIGHYLRNNIDAVVKAESEDTQDDQERAAIRQAILAEANRLDPDGTLIDI